MPNVIVPRPGLWKPPAGSVIDLGHPLARDLQGSWDLLEGSGTGTTDNALGRIAQATPGGGTTNTSILRPGSTWESAKPTTGAGFTKPQGVIQRVVRFDGTTACGIDITGLDHKRWIPRTANFSVECWAVFTGSNGNPNTFFISFDNNSGGNSFWWLGNALSPISGAASFGVTDSARAVSEVKSAASITDKWTHLVGVRSNGLLTLYVNGVFEATVTDNSGDATQPTNVGKLFLGGRWNGGDPGIIQSQMGAGSQISHARYWRRSLSPEEVKWLYEEPYAMFRGPEIMRRYWAFGGLPPSLPLPQVSSHTMIRVKRTAGY